MPIPVRRITAAGKARRLPAAARVIAVMAMALGAAACADARTGDVPDDDAETARAAAERTPTHVDSILPIEEELRRFRATLDERPGSLGGRAATDRDRLVLDFIEAVERQDTAALAGALLTRAEFAYLYYPYTKFTSPPWEMPPALVWFQITQNGGKGLARLLRTYAGRDLGYRGYRCEPQPRVEGPNRLWEGCTVELKGEDGVVVTKRLFGTILDRDGRFKFVSCANDL